MAVGRPKKAVPIYDASAATIRQCFARRAELEERAKEGREAISEMERAAEAAGVCSHVLGICRRLAKMKPGRRGFTIALLARYLQVLRAELHDPEGPGDLGAPEAEPAAVTANGNGGKRKVAAAAERLCVYCSEPLPLECDARAALLRPDLQGGRKIRSARAAPGAAVVAGARSLPWTKMGPEGSVTVRGRGSTPFPTARLEDMTRSIYPYSSANKA
jgi:hypothetical protein